jgi:phage terminase large subunit-like protein
MLRKILSLVLNSKIKKKIEAKQIDDWWFHEEPPNK